MLTSWNILKTSYCYLQTIYNQYSLFRRLQNRLLSHVITLPPNEVVQVLKAIAGTPTGGAMACRFLQAKWYDLQSKMGAGSVNFARVISAITQYGATKFDYDEVCIREELKI